MSDAVREPVFEAIVKVVDPRAPVFVLSDLDMGMNQWISKAFRYPEQPMQRGKILWEKDLDALKGNWARYLDKDGDAVPYRTVPGNRHAASAYFPSPFDRAAVLTTLIDIGMSWIDCSPCRLAVTMISSSLSRSTG